MPATITTAAEAAPMTVLGETMRPLLTTENGSNVEIYDTLGHTGMGPPPHHHAWSETYIMVSGALDVVVDGGPPRRLERGDVAHVPGGTTHGYRIAADDTQFFTILSAGNGAAFFKQMDAEVTMPPDLGMVASIAAAHGITLDV